MFNWARDPDCLKKFRTRRLNLKAILIGGFLLYHLIQWKCRQVESFDRLKRKEQRAMQNKEAEEVYDKKVRFVLFTADGQQFTEETI